MRSPPLILVADDNAPNVDILRTRLTTQGYDVVTATDGEEALSAARGCQPDLILLDVMMPKHDGFEVCRLLRADQSLPFMPIILVTAKDDPRDIVTGLECGADEYLTKPVDQAALVARVRSILRVKALYDTVQDQAQQLAQWNRRLEERVAEQLAELERVNRLKRFLAPQVANSIISGEGDHLLDTHRRDVAVVFIDLRGFTSLAESAEPEEITQILSEYHGAVGKIIYKYEGTLERFLGDGLMVLFNDPIPCPEPALRAVKMAIETRDRIGEISHQWRKQGYDLGFGVGIAQGFATLGRIGFEGRSDYAAIGTVPNLASRLCDEAKTGQILISQRVHTAIEEFAETETLGMLSLKGLTRPVSVYNVLSLRKLDSSTV